MRDEVKKIWLEKLRSGEYKQGQTLLKTKTSDTFCCLGILTQCYIESEEGKENNARWEEELMKLDEGCSLLLGDSRRSNAYLADEVMDWAGLDKRTGNNPRVGQSYLANLNDDGMSFPEIANLIEKHL